MTDHNQTIRADIQCKRKQLSLQAQQQASQALMQRIITLDCYQQSQHIACYFAQHGECDPSALAKQAWRDGKQCYLPVVGPAHGMQFVWYDEHTPLKPNHYGILEPSDTLHTIEANDLDMVLVPVVAFNHTLHRMGMGSGYYDRYFATHRADNQPQLIGLAYDWQASDEWQCYDWDLQCDQIITAHT